MNRIWIQFVLLQLKISNFYITCRFVSSPLKQWKKIMFEQVVWNTHLLIHVLAKHVCIAALSEALWQAKYIFGTKLKHLHRWQDSKVVFFPGFKFHNIYGNQSISIALCLRLQQVGKCRERMMPHSKSNQMKRVMAFLWPC